MGLKSPRYDFVISFIRSRPYWSPPPRQCRTWCRKEPRSISDVVGLNSKSSSYQSKTAQSTMTAPTQTPILPDIPFFSPLSSVTPIITSDLSPQPLITHSPTTTTQPTFRINAAGDSEPTAVTASPDNRLSNGRLIVVIVVPIVLLAILSPILLVWFLSWRRRRRHRSHQRRFIPKEVNDDKEWENEEDPVASPPQARQLRRSLPKRSIASLPPPPRRPFTTSPDRRRSTQQLRTSRIPDRSLSGFNFDFSRRATMFSTRSTQPTIRDSSLRPPSTYTWILPPPSASRPTTLAQPYIPSRTQTPSLPESPLAAQNLDPMS